MNYEYLTPWARQCRIDEIEAKQEEDAKQEEAERLTLQLEKHLDASEWAAIVPHPSDLTQKIEVRALLSEYLTEVLDNNHTVAQVLILARTKNPQTVPTLLNKFTQWYYGELVA